MDRWAAGGPTHRGFGPADAHGLRRGPVGVSGHHPTPQRPGYAGKGSHQCGDGRLPTPIFSRGCRRGQIGPGRGIQRCRSLVHHRGSGAGDHCEWTDGQPVGYKRGRRGIWTRIPGQRLNRPGHPPGDPESGRANSGRDGQGNAGIPWQIYLLLLGKRGPESLGAQTRGAGLWTRGQHCHRGRDPRHIPDYGNHRGHRPKSDADHSRDHESRRHCQLLPIGDRFANRIGSLSRTRGRRGGVGFGKVRRQGVRVPERQIAVGSIGGRSPLRQSQLAGMDRRNQPRHHGADS